MADAYNMALGYHVLIAPLAGSQMANLFRSWASSSHGAGACNTGEIDPELRGVRHWEMVMATKGLEAFKNEAQTMQRNLQGVVKGLTQRAAPEVEFELDLD